MKFLLDTNVASDLIKENEIVKRHLDRCDFADLAFSSVTQGEILFGLARKPDAVKSRNIGLYLLERITILPWDENAATTYGQLKAEMQSNGLSLSEIDMLIAAQSLAEGLVLITSDKAFRNVPGLDVENWRE